MSLLIKKGIFEENLARFYIAELTLAIESVHKMGFIHRYVKFYPVQTRLIFLKNNFFLFTVTLSPIIFSLIKRGT